jgi:acetylornithine deacetylase/succinyl-diaminopimelate desuccinylase-like protein
MATLTQPARHAAARAAAELAARPGVREALAWFAANRRWINERHVEICRIPAPTFQETERGAWMANQFRDMGCEVRVDRAGNVIAYLSGSREGRLVALTAHLDTVLAPRGPEDITIATDGKFLGPGVSDNGPGLAALLAIPKAIRETALREAKLPFVFVANVGEEGEGNLSGMRYMCRPGGLASRVAGFIVLDGPSVEHITCRAVASRRFEITLSGPGGHSWSDYGVGNPVHALAQVITLFSQHPSIRSGAGPRFSFNFGLIEGGASVNSIPVQARAKVDLRAESMPRLDEMAALLSLSVEKATEAENQRASGGRISAKIREIGSRPGGQLPDDTPIVCHIRAVDAHLNIRSQLDCASTDANIPLSLGMQAVSIGAGGKGGGAHTPNEWFHPEGRETGLQRILLALCLLAQEAQAAR